MSELFYLVYLDIVISETVGHNSQIHVTW